MSLMDNGSNMFMPVAPAYGGNAGGYGYDGGLFWIIVLFLFAAMNGNGWGVGSGGASGEVQRVVDQQSVMNSISTLAASQANGFANAEISRCNANQNIMQQLNMISMAVAQEGSATRANTDAKVQLVLDKLCQLEIDGIKQNYENRIAGMQNTIDSLRLANSNARFDASQNAQTAAVLADNAAQTVTLEQYLAPTPRPAYVVQNPDCCSQQTFGCGCGSV